MTIVWGENRNEADIFRVTEWPKNVRDLIYCSLMKIVHSNLTRSGQVSFARVQTWRVWCRGLLPALLAPSREESHRHHT